MMHFNPPKPQLAPVTEWLADRWPIAIMWISAAFMVAVDVALLLAVSGRL